MGTKNLFIFLIVFITGVFALEKIETLTLSDLNINPASVITYGNYAYFGSNSRGNPPASIVKIDLSNFTLVDSVFLPEINSVRCAVVLGNHGFFATGFTDPAIILRVDLDTLSYSNITVTGAANISAAVIYGGFGYFATETAPAQILRINLSTFSFMDKLNLFPVENVTSAVLSTGDTALFGTNNTNAEIVGINLSSFTFLGSISTDSYLSAGTTLANFGYYGSLFSGLISKVSLTPFGLNGTTDIDIPYLSTAVSNGNFAYFGTYAAPAQIIQFDMADSTVIANITLNAGEDYLVSSVIVGDIAYFGTNTTPGQIIKVSVRSDCPNVVGGDLPHKANRIVYKSDSYCGSSCYPIMGLVYCYGGQVSGNTTFGYPTCVPNTTCSCMTDWGQVVPHNETITMYQNDTICGSTCSSISVSITCLDGTFDENTSILHQFCTENQSCETCPDGKGGTVPNNTSVIVYLRPNICAADCSSLQGTRTCLNGVWTGNTSYTHLNCTPNSHCPCYNSSGDLILAFNKSKTVYSQSSFCGSSCNSVKGSIYCDNGNLTGDVTFGYQNCSVETAGCPCTNALGGVLLDGEYRYVFSDYSPACTTDCEALKGKIKCVNGTVYGNTDYGYYKCYDCGTTSLSTAVNATLDTSTSIIKMFFPVAPNVTVAYGLATENYSKCQFSTLSNNFLKLTIKILPKMLLEYMTERHFTYLSLKILWKLIFLHHQHFLKL
jgi:hypothetical protein